MHPLPVAGGISLLCFSVPISANGKPSHTLISREVASNWDTASGTKEESPFIQHNPPSAKVPKAPHSPWSSVGDGNWKVDSARAAVINWTITSQGQAYTVSFDMSHVDWSTVIQTYDTSDLAPSNFSLRALNDTYNRLEPMERGVQMKRAIEGTLNVVKSTSKGLEGLCDCNLLVAHPASHPHLYKRSLTTTARKPKPTMSAARRRRAAIMVNFANGAGGAIALLGQIAWTSGIWWTDVLNYSSQAMMILVNFLLAWLAYTGLEDWRDWTLMNCLNALLCRVAVHVRDDIEEERRTRSLTSTQAQHQTTTAIEASKTDPPDGGLQTTPPQQASQDWLFDSGDRLELGPQTPSDNSTAPFEWDDAPLREVSGAQPFSASSSSSFLGALRNSLRQTAQRLPSRRLNRSTQQEVVEIELGDNSRLSVPAEFLAEMDEERLLEEGGRSDQ